MPTNNVNPKAFSYAQIALKNPKQQMVLLSDYGRSNQAENANLKLLEIILHYPLQHTKRGILERYFYPLMILFFRRADRLKPIAICSSWRVQK